MFFFKKCTLVNLAFTAGVEKFMSLFRFVRVNRADFSTVSADPWPGLHVSDRQFGAYSNIAYKRN